MLLRFSRISIAAVAVMAFAGTALAQMSPHCQGLLEPARGLSFDDSDHFHWYQRYWTGKCDRGLSSFQYLVCSTGDGWDDTVRYLIARHGLQDDGPTLNRLCNLGRIIGHEWARANDIRRISTADLAPWPDRLRETDDLPALLDTLEAWTRARMQGQ